MLETWNLQRIIDAKTLYALWHPSNLLDATNMFRAPHLAHTCFWEETMLAQAPQRNAQQKEVLRSGAETDSSSQVALLGFVFSRRGTGERVLMGAAWLHDSFQQIRHVYHKLFINFPNEPRRCCCAGFGDMQACLRIGNRCSPKGPRGETKTSGLRSANPRKWHVGLPAQPLPTACWSRWISDLKTVGAVWWSCRMLGFHRIIP